MLRLDPFFLVSCYNKRVKFGFIGAYDPSYPRNAVIRKGLAALGDEVAEYPAPQGFKIWLRYPTLLARLAAGSPRSGPRVPLSDLDCFFVPEFCQKDVPLGRFLATLLAKPLVFDPLAPRYETKILDWKRRPPSSLHAWWNFRIDAWSFRLSDLILADTGAHKDHFCRTYGVPAGRIGVIPVGYDDELFDPERLSSCPRTGPFTVLFFGSFLPLHGVDSAVEAAASSSAATLRSSSASSVPAKPGPGRRNWPRRSARRTAGSSPGCPIMRSRPSSPRPMSAWASSAERRRRAASSPISSTNRWACGSL